jgi:hypothetical protein
MVIQEVLHDTADTNYPVGYRCILTLHGAADTNYPVGYRCILTLHGDVEQEEWPWRGGWMTQ